MSTRFAHVLFVILALVFSAASAQETATVIGTIDATLDGEAMTWYQIEITTPEGTASASTWSNIAMTLHNISLQGFVEPSYALDGALAISVSLMDGLPEGCPCTYADFEASVLYLSSGSMFSDLYTSDEEGGAVTVVIDVFEPIGDGVYRVEGSFEATLVYVESMTAGADPDDSIEIVGDFVVERLPEEPLAY